ncbi:23S rRNA (uracil(1939)-C(5))-methyltransferase RlmD [Acholeplasma equifetale]|uniref:23S rRNA (uracil(1939)-C(5))-methyltransferase RlmD n=1 Tax=Acholeplasma equifetale TaxID=264634 RepID=UPI00068F240E|nr:23S rRNA (uracil(1939)-C(5))-methyltransferase RlmD [Acholeplasma equifetale]
MRTTDKDMDYIDLSKSKTYEKMPFKEQLKIKSDMIQSLFNMPIRPIIPNPKPKNYRHKAVLSAYNIKVGQHFQIRLGLYQEGSKKILPTTKHYLHDKEIDAIFITIEKLLIKYKFRAYHEKSGEGIIKHVVIRKSYAYKNFLVTIVTQGNLFPNRPKFIKELISLHPNIVTIVQNIHDKNTPIVLLENEKILYGPGYIMDKIGDLSFQISSRSFYQVNPMQMMNLYEEAFRIANIDKKETVLDTYSGIGTITLLAAQKAKFVYGIEINHQAHQNALQNKKINKISNVHFLNGDVEEIIESIDVPIDVLIMDPTRDGASIKFIESIKKLKPKKILYISCEPKTQFRDVVQLSEFYKTEVVQPVDMFSYTAHVENIVLLSLKNRLKKPFL